MAVAFDAVGPSSAGTAGSTSPLTWSHTNNGNSIVASITCFGGSANTVTGVTYGGVSLSLLKYTVSNGGANGGVVVYGLIGASVPTGTNTVSVSFSDSGSNHNAGSVSLVNAGSFGTVFSNTANVTGSVSVSVTGTTVGGMIVAGACFGGGGGSGTFSGTNSVTVRWQRNGTTASSADNGVEGTVASAGGNQTVGFSNSATGDDWGIVAVEVLPAAGTVMYPAQQNPLLAWPYQQRWR